MTPEAVTLSQLANYIKSVIDSSDIKCWVVAEIQSISFSKHCYIEFVENSEATGRPVAQMRFNMWSNVASVVLPRFESETGQQLKAGMKVMVYATVHYHELYGLSGNITDINSEFTLGDLERQRRETIRRLTEEGVIDLNRQLPLPTALKRIAVVSSETAAGYGDFMNQINGNSYGLTFDVSLYPALMQGNDAPQSIIDALQKIADSDRLPDIVVIIRGGGARTDLLCFDDYNLAFCIAGFPCPVLTGIGHERDNSVCDIVANVRVKTPTAAAEFIVGHNAALLATVMQLRDMLHDAASDALRRRLDCLDSCRNRLVAPLHNAVMGRMQRVERISSMLKMAVSNKRNAQRLRIEQLKVRLQHIALQIVSGRQQRIDNAQKTLAALDPTDTLRRGYTLTVCHGRRVLNAADVRPGDVLNTYTPDGRIVSVVTDDK